MPVTVAQLIAEGRAVGLDPVDVRVLACAAWQVNAAWLRAHDRDDLTQAQSERLRGWFERRLAGEPVAYIVGRREFFGLDLAVAPGVLIPRPETELLVELGLKLGVKLGVKIAASNPLPTKILDLGTGSGAIALAMKSQLPTAQVTAVEVSQAALTIARSNGERLQLDVAWRLGPWYQPVAGERFDLILSNPPYIVPGDLHLQQGDLRFEPLSALVGAGDGLDDIRTIVAQAAEHLQPGGWLLFEHGYDQASSCRELLQEAGFVSVQSWADLAGIERVSGGQCGAERTAI